MRALPLLSIGWAWLVVALTLTIPAQPTAADSPPVKVQLQASWPAVRLPSGGSPFLLELLEAARYEQPFSFFSLLHHVAFGFEPSELRSASDEWLAEKVDGILKHPETKGFTQQQIHEALETWRMAVALRDSRPRLQAFAQLYQTLQLDEVWKSGRNDEPCESWVLHQGQVLCSAEELDKAVNAWSEQVAAPTGQQPEQQVAFGHVRAASTGNATAPQAFVLYADPFSSNFRTLFDILEQHSAKKDSAFSYNLRWRLLTDYTKDAATQSEKDRTTLLSGFGAILDLKKVDYLVIDDRKLRDDSQVGDVGISANSGSEEAEAARQASEDLQWLQDQVGAQADAVEQNSMSSLKEDGIEGLGIKATRLVAESSDPLRAIQELSQNFPAHAAALASSTKFDDPETNAEVIEGVYSLGNMRIEQGHSDLWINGQGTPASGFMPLSLLETLRRERRWSHALQHPLAGGGLNATEAIDLLSSSLVGRAFLAQADNGAPAAIFDASDRIEKAELPEGGTASAIAWLNDLETDAATKHWSKDLVDLLRPTWPGSFPRLSINLFNIVLVLDLSQKESCRFLSEAVLPNIGRVGLHWGLVAGGLEDESNTEAIRMARLVWFLLDNTTPKLTADVLRKAADSKGANTDTFDTAAVVKEAKFALKDADMDASLAEKLDEALAGQDAVFTQREQLSRAYIKRLRATREESPVGHIFVNGKHMPFHQQAIHLLHQAVQEQIQVLAPLIYYGQISSATPGLSTHFYDQVGALSFRSTLVPSAGLPASGSDNRYEGVAHAAVDLFSSLLDEEQIVRSAGEWFRFFYPSAYVEGTHDSESPLNSTVWVVADLDSQEGLGLATRSFEALAKNDAKFRLGVVHVPSAGAKRSDAESAASTLVYRLLSDAGQKDGQQDGLPKDVMLKVTPSLIVRALNDIRTSAVEGKQDDLQKQLYDNLGLSEELHHNGPLAFWNHVGFTFASKLGTSGPAILVDGHLVSNFDVSSIEARDITALVEYEACQKLPYITQSLGLLREDFHAMDHQQRQNLIFAALSVMNGVYEDGSSGKGMFTSKATSRSGLPEQLGTPAHVVEFGDRDSANVRVVMLLNPLSESAQRWSSMLMTLSKLQGVYLRIILNPEVKLRELPLKRFYRFSAPERMEFDEEGRAVSPELRFFDMPEDAVLTLGLDAPTPWLTMPKEAVYDLDNIRLSDVPAASRANGVKAVYELKSILIEGHAREELANNAGVTIPRGLQLLLETPDGTNSTDTIVMANLAYFQFKAQPGLWKLRIRPGRSDELYEMKSAGGDGWDSPSIEQTGNNVVIDTLSGLTISPRVAKRKGKELEELIEELDAQGHPVKKQSPDDSLVASASSLLSSLRTKASDLLSSGSVDTAAAVTRKHADINIFTVASGHLYERMTYIMILSVLKHTQSSVKFWFIENFLSPSFKDFIPHLAEAYGFEYELVTYAWPSWLRSQKEKQRTIWGYKILFLDTLFPLDLGKVIFVDADQVVRTDMKELVDLDLQGHVYGMPPMGDDSEDMDGYRFWKQGYWRDYLRGRPYHISALYVVDLNRFRLFAAGDRLRGQYQALSADPNSLSNLDQDLPNNMQSSLPIFTLPQEWLWCETWCSHSWLDKAKTIDLCSNPKTHEPKLDRAKRQIPEWTVYDNEVASLAQRLVEQGKVGKSVVAPKSQVQKTEQVESKEEPENVDVPAPTVGQDLKEDDEAAVAHDEL